MPQFERRWTSGKEVGPSSQYARSLFGTVARNRRWSSWSVVVKPLTGPLPRVRRSLPAWNRSCGVGYSGWLQWLLSGDLEEFYADYRWSGWRDEVGKLPGDRGYSIFPFPWAKGVAISRRSRAPVPLSEIWSLERRSQKSFDRSPSDGEDEPSPEPADPPPGR